VRIALAPRFLRDAFRSISARLGLSSSQELAGGGEEVVILPDDLIDGRSPTINQLRHWRACDLQVSAELVRVVRSAFEALGRHNPIVLNESSTGDHLIEPVLKVLDYPLWSAQHRVDDLRPDYMLREGVGLEIKANDNLNNNIDARNKTNRRFATIAHQVVAYLDNCNVDTMLYSNGNFWWRVERDDSTRKLHALRFDMRQAFNELSNRGTSKQLQLFVPIFHAAAFSPGNNYSIPIHPGGSQLVQPYDEVGPVWMKDLNRGYRNA
jgi:hypothetical protein